MQFNTPQFIDIEDKIFGPLTFKQFIYVLGGGGASFMFYSLFPTFIAVIFIVPVCALTFLLAFKPIHGRPFAVILESSFRYFFGNKLYLWRKEERETEKKEEITLASAGDEMRELAVPKVIEGRLDALSWNLDVKNKADTM